MFLLLLVGLYLLAGDMVLDLLLKTRLLRPLTDREMLEIVIFWPLWL